MHLIKLKNEFCIYVSKYGITIVSGLKVISFQSIRVKSTSLTGLRKHKKPDSNRVKFRKTQVCYTRFLCSICCTRNMINDQMNIEEIRCKTLLFFKTLLFEEHIWILCGKHCRWTGLQPGLPGGILGYQIDPNLVSKLLVWYPFFLFGILQKFGIRCKQIWYPTRDLVSSVNSNFLSKKLMF